MGLEELRGKKALVTGGTSGIGREVVAAFARAGIQCVFTGTNEKRAHQVLEENKEYANLLSYKLFDVGTYKDTLQNVQEALVTLGHIDILVNGAGVTRDNLLLRMTEEEWDDVIDVNLKSVFNVTKSVLKSMMKQRYGKIINISSVIGLTGNPGQVNYSASKFGMIGFTQSLAKEVATRNICVNCIAPGFIETPMTDKLSEEQKETISQTIPMKRLGQPKDVANLCLFLASPMSDYITGEVIAVDGGITA